MTDIKIILYEGYDEKQIKRDIKSRLPECNEKEIFRKIDSSLFVRREGGLKSLRFVGSFVIKYADFNIVVYCFPKYMMNRNHTDHSEMNHIIKAVEFAGLTPVKPANDAVFNESRQNAFTAHILRSDLADWLIKDYLSNGIIELKVRRTSKRQKGRVDWGKTAAKLIPVTDGDDFVYSQTLNAYYESDDQLLISEIHCCAVVEAAQFASALGRGSVPVPECNASLLGKLEKYVRIIHKVSNIVYEDRKIYLLRALEAWCTMYSRFYNQPVGTVSFELVWERCLRKVFDNVSTKIEGDFRFENPVYHIGDKDYPLNNSQGIPDIVNVQEYSGKPSFMLLDAKYYIGEIQNDKISGYPMYHDISKQFCYFEMLCGYGISPENGVNAFVMPWNDKEQSDFGEWFRITGYVYYPDGRNDIQKRIAEYNKNKGKNNGDSIEYVYKKAKEVSSRVVLLVQVVPERLFKMIFMNNTDKYVKELWSSLFEKCRCIDLD